MQNVILMERIKSVFVAFFVCLFVFPSYGAYCLAGNIPDTTRVKKWAEGPLGYRYRCDSLSWSDARCGIRSMSFKDTADIVSVTPFFRGWHGDSMRVAYIRLNTAFDPANPVDTSLAPSGRWFDLLLCGVAGCEVVMDVCNSDPLRPFYSYDGHDYMRFSGTSSVAVAADGRKVYRCRQFFDRDTVRISYFIPYDMQLLKKRIGEWNLSEAVKVGSIGHSTLGEDMPLLEITDFSVPGKGKKTVYIHGRTHTSEAPSSWHLDALITRLADPDDAYAAALRKAVHFYIVPFTNPDGVACGLSRSNITGVNQEINYARPDSLTVREVANIKSFLDSLVSAGTVDLALNMHSQADDFATYWVHDAKSTSDAYFGELMRFAALTADSNPFIGMDEMSYSAVASRYVEGWFWDNVGERTPAITFETPYSYFGKSGEWVSTRNLDSLALHSVMAIGDYFGVSVPGRQMVSDGLDHGKRIRIRISKDCFGEIMHNPAQEYDVYGWLSDAEAGRLLKGQTGNPDGFQSLRWMKIGRFVPKKGVLAIRHGGKYRFVMIVPAGASVRNPAPLKGVQ